MCKVNFEKRENFGQCLSKKADVTGLIGLSTIEEKAESEMTAYCCGPVIHKDEDPLLLWK